MQHASSSRLGRLAAVLALLGVYVALLRGFAHSVHLPGVYTYPALCGLILPVTLILLLVRWSTRPPVRMWRPSDLGIFCAGMLVLAYYCWMLDFWVTETILPHGVFTTALRVATVLPWVALLVTTGVSIYWLSRRQTAYP